MKGAPNLKPDIEAYCPCGRKFYVDSKHYAVIHEMPMCEKFKSLEPTEFLEYVNQTLGNLL
jgi:hypothetical protein